MAETIDPYDLPSRTFNAWDSAAEPERVKKAWPDCGLFPFNPRVVLDSGKLALSVPFKKVEPGALIISADDPDQPLPDATPLFRRFPNTESFSQSDITMELVLTREFRPFIDHFLQTNSDVVFASCIRLC